MTNLIGQFGFFGFLQLESNLKSAVAGTRIQMYMCDTHDFHVTFMWPAWDIYVAM